MSKQASELLDKHIGTRLRALRVEQGASLDVVAEIIDVSPQQISRYELGHNRLGATQLYRLARGLNIPISWFFHGFEEDKDELKRLETALRENRHDWQAETTQEKEQALLKAWYALPTDLQRKRVMGMLEAFGFKV